jgi:hypothetical protein
VTDTSGLLRAAIEDNIVWCSRVCSVHGSNEVLSPIAWTNLAASPPFYPNFITRERGVQNEIAALADKVSRANQAGGWGIKDSFGDLMLPEQSFERILAGNWYGGAISIGDTEGWTTVASPAELHIWEKAWGSCEDTIFPSSLLDDNRIRFWVKGDFGAIRSGFISFSTGFSVGISNWFSIESHSFAQIGLLKVAGSIARGLPTVCWSTDDLTDEEVGLANSALSKSG